MSSARSRSSYVAYGPDGWSTQFTRANITQHCDWTPSVGLAQQGVAASFLSWVVVVGVVKLVRECVRACVPRVRACVDARGPIDGLPLVWAIPRHGRRSFRRAKSNKRTPIAHQALHFVFYVPLHYRLEVVEVIKKLLTVKPIAWLEESAKDLLRHALPLFATPERRDLEETVTFLDDVTVDFS